MKAKRICLGYDLRLSFRDGLWEIPSYLESQCLVYRKPQLSGDLGVWPAVPGVAELLENHENIWKGISNSLGFATDFEVLIESCKSNYISIDKGVGVAFTCFEENFIAFVERYGSRGFNLLLSEADLKKIGWSFVGFDILDLGAQISGLCGCGYKEDTKKELQAYFADGLNEVGLFKTYSWATRFASVRGLQIHTHAPFIPVGIFIKEI
ncbi:MAG: hypothetical protein LBF61_07970 [Azoarcus sp.]|jgi:hypothetical protein|nr:hypothetical protein [Azoarcus sp.]